MVTAISLLWLKGWHAPAGRRIRETPASDPGQADQTGIAGRCQKNWDPADKSFRRTTRAASAESEVRPGPRLLTLRPYHLKTGEAGPEALPTSCRIWRIRRAGCRAVGSAQIGQFHSECGCGQGQDVRACGRRVLAGLVDRPRIDVERVSASGQVRSPVLGGYGAPAPGFA